MSDFQVTPEALRAASDRLRSESARIEASLRGLEQEASRLRGNWDGVARVAYDNAQAQWSVTQEHMKDVLARIAAGAAQIADDYVDTDKRSAERFSGGK
jgi:early secretory antigenic target protein ESAT-6